MERLGQLLKSDDERVSMRAVEVVLERNLGKAVQPISGADGKGIAFSLVLAAPKVAG